MQPVDDQVAQPALKGQQHPGGRLDGYGRPGHGGQALAPGAGGVDHQIRLQDVLPTGHVVVGDHPGDPPTGGQQAGDLGERLQPGAAQLRGGEKAQRQAHRVHGRVRHPHRRLERRVQARLQSERLGGRQLPGGDAAGGAAGQEPRQVVHVLIGEGDEQPAVLLKRPGGDPAQDLVLGDALHRRLRVVDGIAGARVQQPVVAAGGPRGQLAPLGQRDPQPPQHQIMGQGTSGAAPTDDDHLRRVHLPSGSSESSRYQEATDRPSGPAGPIGRSPPGRSAHAVQGPRL
jgi:hypothetical protein